MDTLELRWRDRPGKVLKSGGTVTARRFLDFVVNGRSLMDILKTQNIGVLGWYDSQQVIDLLLMREQYDSLSNRVPIYVCPECGDDGCGFDSVRITRANGLVQWRDFAREDMIRTNIEQEIVREGVGPFSFGEAAYITLIETSRLTPG